MGCAAQPPDSTDESGDSDVRNASDNKATSLNENRLGVGGQEPAA
jgi:hypothetical protein